jgi:hypothetical protein
VFTDDVTVHSPRGAPHFTGGLRLAGIVVRTPAGWRFREQRITPARTREN